MQSSEVTSANETPRIVETQTSAELEKRYASSHFGGRRPSNREARAKNSYLAVAPSGRLSMKRKMALKPWRKPIA